MKIEFRPEFKALIKLQALWPKLRGLSFAFKFKPESEGDSKRKVVSILSIVILAVVLTIVLIKILSSARR
jgi:hypothetical protein